MGFQLPMQGEQINNYAPKKTHYFKDTGTCTCSDVHIKVLNQISVS